MTTYKILKIENKYLETVNFKVMETKLIDGKRYTDCTYEYDNLPQAQSKLNLLNLLK